MSRQNLINAQAQQIDALREEVQALRKRIKDSGRRYGQHRPDDPSFNHDLAIEFEKQRRHLEAAKAHSRDLQWMLDRLDEDGNFDADLQSSALNRLNDELIQSKADQTRSKQIAQQLSYDLEAKGAEVTELSSEVEELKRLGGRESSYLAKPTAVEQNDDSAVNSEKPAEEPLDATAHDSGDVEQSETVIDELRAELVKTRGELAESQQFAEEFQKLLTENGSVEAIIANSNADLKKVGSDMASAYKELAKARDGLELMQVQAVEANSAIETLKMDLIQLEYYKSQLEFAEAELAEAKAKLEDTSLKLAEQTVIVRRVKSLECDLELVKKEKEIAESLLANAQENNQSLEAAVNSLTRQQETTLQDLTAEIHVAKAATQLAQAESLNAKLDLEAVQSEASQLRDTASTAGLEVKKFIEKLQVANEQFENALQELEESKKQVQQLDSLREESYQLAVEREELSKLLKQSADELDQLKNELVATKAEVARFKKQAEDSHSGSRGRLSKRISTAKPKPGSSSDNLKRIEGIGPKIERLLRDAGIDTFEKLAMANPEKLVQILRAAGTRFSMHSPATWPKQASLAKIGQWETLRILQQDLNKGQRSAGNISHSNDGQDDLTRLEGIGPKTARLLRLAGVKSFGDLSTTSVKKLYEILNRGGLQFRGCDPSTWPQQANLAAEDEWEKLGALWNELFGNN